MFSFPPIAINLGETSVTTEQSIFPIEFEVVGNQEVEVIKQPTLEFIVQIQT